MNSGLPRLEGGLRKREREAWDRPCPLCGRPAAALVETLTGPMPVCAVHVDRAKELGYRVNFVRGGALG